jgi:transcriptional regulator with GAF, ATPase, and Fis domain
MKHIKPPDEAIFIIKEAGDIYLRRNKIKETVNFYTNVLDFLDSRAMDKRLKVIFIETLALLTKITIYEAKIERLNYLFNLMKKTKFVSTEILDSQNQILYQMSLGWLYLRLGEFKKSFVHYDKGWKLAKKIQSPEIQQEVTNYSILALFCQGKIKDSITRYEQTLGNLENIPNDPFFMRASLWFALHYALSGDIIRGLGLANAILNKAKNLNIKVIETMANFIIAYIFLEIDNFQEAGIYIDEGTSNVNKVDPEYYSDEGITYLLGVSTNCYRYYMAGEYTKAIELLKDLFSLLKRIKNWIYPCLFILKVLMGLEKQGFAPILGIKLESEIEKILNWPSILMKGAAFRYRALWRKNKKKFPKEEIYDDLKLSEKYLKISGAKLELARTWIELSRFLLEEGKLSKAKHFANLAYKETQKFSNLNFPGDLSKLVKEYNREEAIFKTVVAVGENIGTLRNIDQLLNQAINAVSRLTGAERALFFLYENTDGKRELKVAATRNIDPIVISEKEFLPYMEMIKEVGNTGKGIHFNKLNKKPGTMNEPKSIICVPIKIRDNILGVFYLDNYLLDNVFSEKDIPLLAALGAQFGIALDNAKAYEKIENLKNQLQEENQYYKEKSKIHFDKIVGNSPRLRKVLAQVEKVAPTNTSVLILGETGVGKELFARTIHQLSNRSKYPLIIINCTNLPESLIHSELFGHEKGAFTGAVQSKPGKFELAKAGTLFLDEVGDLPFELQAKFLRVLEEGQFERLGSSKGIKADFRLIAATNKNLKRKVGEGSFRSDLFYRLNTFPIEIPPLRERKEDIPLLSLFFLNYYAKSLSKKVKGINKWEMKKLIEYNWPGNIRELLHIIERALILTESGEFLKIPKIETVEVKSEDSSDLLPLEEYEKRYILEVLRLCKGKVSGKNGASEILKMRPSTLTSRIKKLGIDKNYN